MTDDDEMLHADYLAGLDDRSLDDVRAMRSRCVDVETGLSYLRRLAQGRLDIVRREVAVRSSGAAADERPFVDQLAEVLSEGPRGGGQGRLSQTLEPTVVDAELEAELDELAGGSVLNGLTDLDDAALAALVVSLEALERRISDRRQACFGPIDALQAEITRRYRDGEATVDALLAGD